jgi:hypothetical protein
VSAEQRQPFTPFDSVLSLFCVSICSVLCLPIIIISKAVSFLRHDAIAAAVVVVLPWIVVLIHQ